MTHRLSALYRCYDTVHSSATVKINSAAPSFPPKGSLKITRNLSNRKRDT